MGIGETIREKTGTKLGYVSIAARRGGESRSFVAGPALVRRRVSAAVRYCSHVGGRLSRKALMPSSVSR